MRISKAFSVCLGIFSCFFVYLSHAVDTLRPGEKLYDTETLISASGVFELGFFGSIESSNEYLGIWFKNDRNKKPVWVANRDTALLDSPGVLSIRYDGNLVISGRGPIPRIVNYGQLATSNNTSAKILDSGNLILMEGAKIIWQSFQYPTDTFLPGMKLGWFDVDTDHVEKSFLVSWLSLSVPGSGSFALGLDSDTRTSFNVWRRDGAYQQIGFWDGHTFRFFFQNSSDSHNFSFVSNSEEIYLTFNNNEGNYFSWFVLASNGEINEFKMEGQDISVVNHSLCDDTLVHNSTGCLVTMPSKCRVGGDFSEIRGLMPNSMVVNWTVHIGPIDCELMCSSNCSCTAYASLRDDETGCEFYYGDKSDLLTMIERGNNTVYVRGDALQSGTNGRQCSIRDNVELLLLQLSTNDDATNVIELSRKKDHELPLLSFSCIAAATDNFSAANKLGEGGFGPVYKGELQGHEIAVKRLSKSSGQGLEEFKNEVKLISKLQHRNLAKVLGCCVEREEKIIIYEYMLNKSLDRFIFDPTKQASLDWRKRVDIIEGIAQGLLYLHKYSRLRIIHRDLKTSNILLDAYMIPKISDFGMARIFFENDSRAKTKRVAGTYFGVILLEIVSGRKNTTFQSDCSLNLLGFAWDVWKDGRCIELMDSTMTDSCPLNELMVCIQVGLLCVQEKAEDRPTMSDIVLMLNNEGVTLPTPKQPAFSTLLNVDLLTEGQNLSQNLVTLSAIEAR
uniref:Receptor-like serine/threonine-protein kinase n=1 Tax=Fagus sylvatica TaxID=28930 RepID=A0A2N9IAJ3_FAGSY